MKDWLNIRCIRCNKNSDGELICQECRDKGYEPCEDCGFITNKLTYNSKIDGTVCDNCIPNWTD